MISVVVSNCTSIALIFRALLYQIRNYVIICLSDIIFFIGICIKVHFAWRKTGINPLTFKKTDNAHDYNGKVFTFITIFELIVVGIYAFKNKWYEYLLPFWYLENPILQKIGWTLLVISLIVVWISQSQMANSWRIGIDENNKTKLVTNGVFSISRNPFFFRNNDCEYWSISCNSQCIYFAHNLIIYFKREYTNKIRRGIFKT